MKRLKQAAKTTLFRTLGERRSGSVVAGCRDLAIGAAYRLHPRARRSRKQLRSLAGAYAGRRCFIIGNGPSLRNTDLSLLRNEITFGLNRVYLLFGELGFATTFLVSVNDHVVEQFSEEILAQPSVKFLSWRARKRVPPKREDVTFLMSNGTVRFSCDPVRRGLWEGATVTFVAMQLAYFMGFDTVILVGVDHSFATQGEANKLVTSQGPDPNHFSPHYFGAGVRWQLPDLETSEVAYQLARQQFEAAGRSIVDATVGGKLTVFPKRDLKDLFSSRDSSAAEQRVPLPQTAG